jgi:hypothetical protein
MIGKLIHAIKPSAANFYLTSIFTLFSVISLASCKRTNGTCSNYNTKRFEGERQLLGIGDEDKYGVVEKIDGRSV